MPTASVGTAPQLALTGQRIAHGDAAEFHPTRADRAAALRFVPRPVRTHVAVLARPVLAVVIAGVAAAATTETGKGQQCQ